MNNEERISDLERRVRLISIAVMVLSIGTFLCALRQIRDQEPERQAWSVGVARTALGEKE
jgi:hypothetical protein